MKLDNELKEKTIDNKVKESSLTLQNLMAEILLKGSQQKVNEEQAKAIPAQILQGWEDLTKKGKALIVQREQMEAYVQDVFNRYDLGKKGLVTFHSLHLYKNISVFISYNIATIGRYSGTIFYFFYRI